MSSVMENRAAVFTSQPQVVEVYRAGSWWAGELLGWRHDDAGACQVWVRMIVGGVEETEWTDLAALRLPEPSAAPRATQATAATQAMPTLRGTGAGDDADTTVGLPLKRDHLRRPAATRAGGRRRAPEGVDASRGLAPSAPVPAAGRHRAPAAAADVAVGRHRAADTGLLAAVGVSEAAVTAAPRDEFPETAAWPVSPARTALPVQATSARRGWTPPVGLEADLLTRPMRLGDQLPNSRRPRVNGSVRGV